LGISLDEVDVFVLSHHHPDHMGGLAWWQQGTFAPGSGQPDLGDRPIYAPEPLTYPGANPILAAQPQRIAEGVATLGAASFVLPFPLALLMPGGKEQALAVNVAGKGIVLITGCGHPGLETLVARAQAVLDAPVVGVIGGLHYEEADAAALQPHIEFLQTLRPELVALSPHDSGAGVRQEFRVQFGAVYRDIAVGEPIHFGG
jgi:7,8-dihydropterin-6-yl-methyl-4-(beta-D-ribofuranosyl)aminobenzene 5'-phosphate synthase